MESFTQDPDEPMPTPTAQAEPVADPFGAEVRRRVAARVPLALVLFGTLAIATALIEAVTFSPRIPSLLLANGALLAVGTSAIVLVRRRPEWSIKVMVVCVNLGALSLVVYHGWNDASAEWCLLMLTALLTSVALVLPWGFWPQLAAGAVAAAGYPIALLAGAAPVLPDATGVLFLANVIVLSAIGASLLQRYPRSDFLLTRELQEREARLRSYFDQSLVGIAIVALDQVWLEVNDKLCEILGFTRRELLERKWTDLSHPADLEDERAEIARIERGESDGYSMDKRLVRKDGSIRHVLVSAQCIRSREGRPMRLVLMVQDITHRKLAESELMRAKEVAETADRSKTDFLARMSHELRTPMNVIFGMTEMALDTSTSAEQQDCLQKTRSAARKLLVLVNDVLDFSKIESGPIDVAPKPFGLRPWLAELIEPLSELAREKELDLVWKIADDVPDSIVADPERLGQVIAALATNAVRFNERGVIEVGVASAGSVTDGDGGLHISVRETGSGFSDGEREMMLAGLERGVTHLPGSLGSAGLRLAICSRLVERLGGRIWHESTDGGFCFHVTTPVRRADPSA